MDPIGRRAVFAVASRRERLYAGIGGAVVAIGILMSIALAIGLPLRAAIFVAAIAILVDVFDLRIKLGGRIEVSNAGITIRGHGLFRPSMVIPREQIVEITGRTAPIFPETTLPFVMYLMPVPVGRCVAIRRKLTPVNWTRWIALRPENQADFLASAEAAGISVRRP